MSAEPGRPDKKRSGLLKRLPLILSVVLGLWIWRGGLGLVIAERELVFQLPAERADIRRFEFQLYDADVLLKRGDYSFSSMGAPADVRSRVQLKEGTYPARLFVWYAEPVPQGASVDVVVADDEEVMIAVPPRR